MSSLQPSTYLQHRHLLQTTSYNHLLLLHLLISRKGKPKQQHARTPPPPRRGVEKPEGPSALQPTTEDQQERWIFRSFISLLFKVVHEICSTCRMISCICCWKVRLYHSYYSYLDNNCVPYLTKSVHTR